MKPPISKRGRRLLDTPPMSPYIHEHFARSEAPWHPVDRPDGYVALCVAENSRRAPDLLRRLARGGDAPETVLGYDMMIGNPEFRRNLAAFLSRSFLGTTVQAENLAVLAGAGSVLELLFYAIADPGDGVLVPTPSYAGFWADLETRDQLRIVPVDTTSDDRFELTTARLDAAIATSNRPIRALLFTNPDNPLGRVASVDQLQQLRAWAEARRIHLVLDEIYALTVFGERPFVSGASLEGGLGEFVHVVWAFSKDFGASGLRCGVLVSGNEEVLGTLHELGYWAACSGHTQYLLSRFVSDESSVDEYVHAMRHDLREAHSAVTAALRSAGIAHIPAEAAFFLLLDLREYLEDTSFAAEDRLWRRLLDEANVNLTPGSACRIAEPGFFRLCYAGVPLDAVRVAIERIGRCLWGPA
ncbi:MAG: aminotransferase class I/II-fold pyridoxal phosphate-dependent enzyme [Candidatus Eisenbacteria bacterium]